MWAVCSMAWPLEMRLVISIPSSFKKPADPASSLVAACRVDTLSSMAVKRSS